MLTALVRFSLRFRGVVLSLACALAAYGLYTLSRARYDVFPEFAPPEVTVQTEAPGLSPEEVERLVTQPIENALNGAAGIASLRSDSILGLSVITVAFQPGTDLYRDRQGVAERIASLAGQLPAGAQPPLLTPLTSSTGDLMSIGLTSDRRSLMALRTAADWTIKRRLLAAPGVASVGVFGGEVKQIQIQIDPDRLIRRNLAVEEVLAAARRAVGVRGAGFIDTGNQRIILQSEGPSTLDALAKTVVAHEGAASVLMGDLADIVEAPAPPISAASVMGTPGVVLNVWAQYGANTLETTARVDQALEELRPALDAEGIRLHPGLFRAANFVETATRNIRSSLLIGAALVILVLFLFLFDLRTAAISCAAIPLSLLAGVTALEYLGFSLNIMTLGGLAIAIGEVVDDAVIDVENILRRLRENRRLPNPRPPLRVVLDASIEVRGAVVYATFAVLLVFIPVLTLSGVAGRLFAPLGTAYIFAVLASLLTALTVTPALCLVLLGRRDLPPEEPRLIRGLKEKYRALLLRVERRPRAAVGGAALFTLAALAALPFLGGGFLPELREGHFIVHMTAIPGTSLAESLRLGRQVTLALLKIPYVRSVAQRVGRAAADDTFGTHASEFEVDLKPLKRGEAERAPAEIRRALSRFLGVNFAVNTFLTERVEETLSGYAASVVIDLVGNDLNALDRKAQEVAGVLRGTPGATDVQVQSPPGTPQLAIRLRKDDLVRWGFDPTEALDVIHAAYQGEVVGQVYEDGRVFDLSVILAPRDRKSPAAVGNLPLRGRSGGYLPLRRISDLYGASGRYGVLHEGARRVQIVTCNVAGRDIRSFVAEARRRLLSSVSLPPDIYLQFTGAAEAQARSRRDLLAHSLLAGAGVVLLLSVVTGSGRNLALILINLPFALAGGVLAAFASGGEISTGSLIGFVTLFGITLRNAVMMISHYERLVSAEGMAWGPEAAIRGASERLAPILMTALVTGLGLLPLAIGSGDPGREIEGPMAIVILGGLITSTSLNLLVLPTLALRYGRFERTDPEAESIQA